MAQDIPHLRRREGEEQTTSVELFFDLVYVFAVTQLSHHLLEDLTWAGAARTAFLLAVIWWAWIYTTWMVNWFDPAASPAVRAVLIGVMLGSLLMAAALPRALGADGTLFAGAYVALQAGRNVASMVLAPRSGHPLRATAERLLAWSLLTAPLWLAGALALDGDDRLWLWGAALAIEIAAPLLGYWMPGRGRNTLDLDIEGSHFAERFQGFVIITLGESIVVTGATAAGVGLHGAVVPALAVAFLGTAALWWLYFGEVAEHSRRMMADAGDASALARDAYTYLHLPIVAGVIVAAVGNDLVIAHPDASLATSGALMVCGGPLLFLLGETLFRVRMVGNASPKRITAIVALGGAAFLAPHVSALVLSGVVLALLTALALWEYAGGADGVGDQAERSSAVAS